MMLLRAALILLVLCLPFAGPAGASNDPGYGDQWGLAKVGAPQAWGVTQGGRVVVAVVDSGVDLDHEDLRANLVAGRNFVEDGSAPQDDDGHGTHVAGIVAALTGNGKGVASLAPQARIMPVRVLETRQTATGEETSGSMSDVSAGIRWAADQGADVINLSLGEDVLIRNVLGSQMQDALAYAWSKGSVPVVAAGNDALFPSGYGDVDAIVVAATDREDRRPSYSNGVGSARWGMAAPGGSSSARILSTWLDGYAEAYGTSMAAPHVSGAAALLFAKGSGQRQVVDTLLATAKDIGASGRDSTFGSGRLDAARAVGASAPDPTSPPASSSDPTSPPSGGSSRRPPAGTSSRAPAGDTPEDDAVVPVPSEGTTEGSSDGDALSGDEDGSSPLAAPDAGSDGEGGSSAPMRAAAALGGVLMLGGAGVAVSRLRGRTP